MTSVRLATEADRPALRRLAGRDSSRLPDGPLLIALEGGEPRAAIAGAGGRVIADPFHPTAHLVAALRAVAGGPVRATATPRRVGFEQELGLAR